MGLVVKQGLPCSSCYGFVHTVSVLDVFYNLHFLSSHIRCIEEIAFVESATIRVQTPTCLSRRMTQSVDFAKLWPGVASLLLVLPGAHAMDGGDAVAFVLGIAISVVGFCACLGFYSRKRRGETGM
ncbi:small integral membrane protein 30 [Ambystoma mexicanum]|uniref:small integral membrane protein 30 n=1 Tax=Ambystoma mexicanum TaxID=8296 RepID=UPI0037E83E43